MDLIVFIIGTTASGKTKLSVNLGEGYEIISCDSMQIYKEADIMTAKATKKEQALIPHHGIDIVDLDHQGFTRKDWLRMAREKIKEIQSRKHIPVIVGGTTYYLEPLLFQCNEDGLEEVEIDETNLYQQLLELDPNAAQKFHPNDKRRIKNAVKFIKSTGKLSSETPDLHSDERSLKVENFLILWPRWSSRDNLNFKIEQRIKDMIYKEGGLEEMLSITKLLKNKQESGVLQSIGYRQFNKLFEAIEKQGLTREDPQFQQLLSEGEAQLLKDTINYTKKQLQWIKNRLLQNPNLGEIGKRLYIFEFEKESDFLEKVIQPGRHVFESFKTNTPLDSSFDKFRLSSTEIERNKQLGECKSRANWQKYSCDTCKKEVNGPVEYNQHINSKQHKILSKRAFKAQKAEQKSLNQQS